MKAGKGGGVVLPKAEFRTRKMRLCSTSATPKPGVQRHSYQVHITEMPRSTGAAEDSPYHAGASYPAKRIWEHFLRL